MAGSSAAAICAAKSPVAVSSERSAISTLCFCPLTLMASFVAAAWAATDGFPLHGCGIVTYWPFQDLRKQQGQNDARQAVHPAGVTHSARLLCLGLAIAEE